MNLAYFDCFSGAAGDMVVASLIDAGAEVSRLRSELSKLGLTGYALDAQRVTKQGFAATHFAVTLEPTTSQPHRHLRPILQILEQAAISPHVRGQAAKVFERLAEAEAKVHGTTQDRVHFHEVGAVDAIIDVVGTMIALEMLGVERVVCSAIPVGSGTVTCSHGVMPVPAPATAELLKGVPIAGCDEPGELTTPTGAALLTTLASEWGSMPAMCVRTIGYGAGTRDGKTRPNVMRVLIGESGASGNVDEIAVLETQIDDATPEIIGHCVERLLKEGARDVFTVPIQMKKSRPGVLLTVLCEPSIVSGMERILFVETTTFGIRRHTATRSMLQRRHDIVTTIYGDIRVKIGEGFGVTTVSPEYDDCRFAAEKCGVAVRTIMDSARTAWRPKNSS
ncbi:MAG: nickel pincer cofactor biosynthesis protein LarC [Planctomycetota bacterium]